MAAAAVALPTNGSAVAVEPLPGGGHVFMAKFRGDGRVVDHWAKPLSFGSICGGDGWVGLAADATGYVNVVGGMSAASSRSATGRGGGLRTSRWPTGTAG